ncbi:MAG: aldehyde dehydrogenase (NADP(+)) [Crocinitomicaceae bacterium]|nr:aldehyde dehydrogenase (NADP(+)) [Crocinitomicaceae bacterium]
MLTGKNYVGNKLSANGDVVFTTLNPKLNIKNSVHFTEASDDEINEAVKIADIAFDEFKGKSNLERAKFLNAIADEILALDSELIDVYMSETGLPEGRAIGERGRTIGQLRNFAALLEEGSWVDARIDTAIPDREPIPKADLRKMNVAIGPIVVFGASNFPLAYSTAGGDTASALAAGCPVIVKVHPMHAGTSELVGSAIVKAAEKTGMPNGVFSNLNSKGIELGRKLVSHPKIKGVGFTGSIKGGRALYNLAAARPEPIPVFAEMGSINPVVILPEYLANNASSIGKTYAGSITLGAGQFCTNPGLILCVNGDKLNEFLTVLSSEIEQAAPQCMLHPLIKTNFLNANVMMQQQKGVEVIASYGDSVDANYASQVVARVSGDEFLNNPNLHHEVFGPYSLVVVCDDAEQMEEILRGLEGQLTGTILGEVNEISRFSGVVSTLQNRVGRVIFNGVPTGVEVCPSMLHGGPYPASTDSRFTAVGTDSIKRWVRPLSFQNWPNEMLPKELKNENPLNIIRKVDNLDTKNSIS